MPPKNNSQKKKAPKVIPHKDNYARVLFLYQAANHFAVAKNSKLSRNMVRSLDLVAKKTTLKLSPSLKRTLCKKCSSILIPGLTMTMRIENLSKQKTSHNDVLVHKCMTCQETKRFPVGKNRDYVAFSERDDVQSIAS